jgi:hypothetical protein
MATARAILPASARSPRGGTLQHERPKSAARITANGRKAGFWPLVKESVADDD